MRAARLRVVVSRYNGPHEDMGLRCFGGDYPICIYDPGHFTPYYNAGLCGQFAARGLECTLLTSPATFEPVPPGDYETLHVFFPFLQGPARGLLRRRPKLRQLVKALAYPFGVWRTYRTLQGKSPGVFHVHTAVLPPLDAILCRALRRRGWHIVYTLQERHPKTTWERWSYGQMVEASHAVAMHGEGLAAKLREMYPHFAQKITALTHGMDLPALPSEDDRARARAWLGVGAHEKLLLFFGMIKPYKGIEDLVDAMPAIIARMPNVRLCIAGEPLMNMRAMLDKLAELPKGSAILHLEFVPQDAVGRYFAAADLVAACYREIPASSVLLQAQSYACPVIATRVGALPALLDHGHCGFLAGENLAESIVEALSDANRLKEIGQRGREHVERRYSWSRAAEETLNLYPAMQAAKATPHQ